MAARTASMASRPNGRSSRRPISERPTPTTAAFPPPSNMPAGELKLGHDHLATAFEDHRHEIADVERVQVEVTDQVGEDQNDGILLDGHQHNHVRHLRLEAAGGRLAGDREGMDCPPAAHLFPHLILPTTVVTDH